GLVRDAAPAAAVAVTFASWAIVDATTDGLRPLSAAARADQVDESLSERVRVWKVFSRGWLDKPLSGWGPGTGQGAFLSSAGVRDMRVLGRGWADAHNLFVQSATTTGVLGTVALIALWAVVAAKAWRKPGEAWIFGAVAALGVYHLLQPLSVILTPMLFLFGGMLLKEAAQEWKALRHGVVALLAVGVVLSCMRFGASWAERSGRIYGSQTALRRASSLDPWRVRAPHELALSLAIDSRAGRSGAASEAFRISSSTVREHRWEPTVRSLAADVSLVARDFEQARVWLVEQVGRFPNDYATLSSASQLFLSEGDLGLAKQFASRALEIRPFDRRARAVLRQVEKRQIDAMKGASALAAMEEGPPRGGPS
ncbi:MAG TPA: O-antigen ligase family protein, partial [Actinomycetota bacterium]|nr:O-antigen ligase family protein [Actinomycetota bacterium]